MGPVLWYGGLGVGLVVRLATAALLGGAEAPAPSLAPTILGGAFLLGLLLVTAWAVSRVRRSLRAAAARAEASARAAQNQQLRLAFLAEASNLLGASLDDETTFRTVVHLAVPFLADVCTVDVLEGGGSVRRLAAEHANPAMQRIVEESSAPRVPDLGQAEGIRSVLETGEPELHSEVSDAVLVRMARDAEELAAYRRVGVRSAMAVPLLARGRTLGVMSFMASESGRHYGPLDLALAEDLAGRCGAAIDNARLYREAQREITERQRVEEQLRESEERLQLAFDAAQMGTWDWNLTTGEIHVDWADRFAARHLVATAFGASFEAGFELVHPDDRALVTEAISRAVQEGHDFDVETRVFWPDGTVRWIAAKGKVLRDEAGRPVRLVGVPRDVTERKRAEQRLAVQYATTRILAECATLAEAAPRVLRAVCECLGWVHGALWRVDGEAGVLRCVDTWHAAHVDVRAFDADSRGRTFTPGIGLPGRVWATGAPAWIPDVVEDANFPRAPIAARDGLHAAFGFPIRSGREVLGVLEFFSPRILPPEEPLLTMIATIGTQIGQFIERRRVETERSRLLERVQAAHAEARAAERRAAFLAEASTALAASLDSPAILENLARLAVPSLASWCTVDVLADGGSVRRVAAAHADPAKAELLRDLPERVSPPLDHPVRAAIAAGHSVLLEEVAETTVASLRLEPRQMEVVRQLDIRSFMLVPLVARGRVLGAIALASPVPGRFGAIELGLAEDLARRAALAVDNARLYREAQEEARRKDEFLAMLGHELRNPLAAIHGATQVLDRIGWESPQAPRHRAIIERQTRQLARLVDDLLDVARVVSGKIVLQHAPVDLNEAAARCLQSLEPRLQGRRHEATFVPADERVLVRGDTFRLEQVIFNLLDNAVKYTPPGGQIRMSVERVGREGVVRVRDTGIGMSPELLPHVFDMFAQAERALDRAAGGLGLGLTLVRRLVEQHGGTVAANSPGNDRGSEFIVSLPLMEDAGAAESPGARGREHPQAPGRHILLIEDNDDGREALRALLELLGHRVDVAGDGPGGLEIARRSPPDVAVIDIGLPGVDGYQVASALRVGTGRRVRLVALTGYGMPEDRRRALEAGFDAHLVKPVDPEELARVLALLEADPA